ncbi:MAG: type II secretion system F family protein [Candidatus Aenigmatarchaeota archaeon]|nr:type II secretion system F family protein [Candidatus Aenigmarchaeota archaeon]
MKKLTIRQISFITIGISAVLIITGIITSDAGIIGNSIILSTFIIAAPILYIRYKRLREFKEMEEKFPNFLRDLVESIRAGLPLHKAIIAASKINYGTLSKEVNKMANQLSWRMPIDKVLSQFAHRVKNSKRMASGIQVILQSYLSGGDVISTIDSVADSQLTLIEVEKEKSSALSQYVVVMYAISLIFIGIVVAVNKLMIPIFGLSQQGTEFGLLNPCDTCVGLECSVCSLFETTSGNIFGLDPKSIGAYYTALFFFMSITQSIFSGLVAGQISEGSAIAGARHSLILASITFGIFSILVRLGLLGS